MVENMCQPFIGQPDNQALIIDDYFHGLFFSPNPACLTASSAVRPAYSRRCFRLPSSSGLSPGVPENVISCSVSIRDFAYPPHQPLPPELP